MKQIIILYMEIYHYTKSKYLSKIVTEKGLSFRGSYFEEFSNTDYRWAKRVALPIISKICKKTQKKINMHSSFKPVIISFCECDTCEYMWSRYADGCCGLQFVLDFDIIRQHALSELDYCGYCVYMHKRGRIRKFLLSAIQSLNVICSNDNQFNFEALSALIKPIRFRKEKEIRYIHDYPIICNFNSNQKCEDKFFTDSIPKKDDDWYRYVCFPKRALKGIIIGSKSPIELADVEKLLRDKEYDLSKIRIERYE